MEKILVIKHGALGDVVLATGPFAAIRSAHADAHITLLSTKLYANMLKDSPYFDDIWVDSKPKLYRMFSFFSLLRKISDAHFSRIYDLQTSERTGWYHRFMPAPKPEWSGIAPGASHRHDTPHRTKTHTVERQKEQLAIAGIMQVPAPDISWFTSDISRFKLPKRYALIIPGGSAHRPGKRWPANYYGELCNWLVSEDILPVLIGTKAESSVLSTIESLCPAALNLGERTIFADLAELGRSTLLTIGNDTGPTHLVAVAGSPIIVLFSQYSNPTLCAPRGKSVTVLERSNLSDLKPADVIAAARKLLSP